jgi:hypothetical protein
MTRPVSIRRFRDAIKKLPSDRPRDTPGKRYKTEKEHWLGWLGDYNGPGYYGRQDSTPRNAKLAYNRIVEVKMLLYLAKASRVSPSRLAKARAAERTAPSLQAKSGAVRKVIPWEVVEEALWPK